MPSQKLFLCLWTGLFLPAMVAGGQTPLPKKKQDIIHKQTPPSPGGVQAAVDAYVRGDFSAALSAWRSLADKGNAFAQTWVAQMYILGEGAPKDPKEGAKYADLAIKQGDPSLTPFVASVHTPGLFYAMTIRRQIQNEKTKSDYAEAAACFRQSAEAGHPAAQRILGNFYVLGLGLPMDPAGATIWWQKAADGNDDQALVLLGQTYERGLKPLLADPQKALTYYRRAADLGSADAMSELGFAYKSGELGVSKDYSAAEQWFLRLREKDAERGERNLSSLYLDIAWAYELGNGVIKDRSEAAKWFRKAADSGNRFAAKELADLYRTGDGVPKDYAKADELSQRYVSLLRADAGAPSGNGAAMEELADVYADGKYVPANYQEAARLYRELAEEHSASVFPHALAKLARLYENGQGGAQDKVQAYLWFSLSAANGWAAAKADRDRLEASMTQEQVSQAQALAREWNDKHGGQTVRPVHMLSASSDTTDVDPVASAVDRVRGAPHSVIPEPQRISTTTGDGIVIENATPYGIRVYFKGSTNRTENIPSGSSITVKLDPGEYEVAAEVPNSAVLPFYGKQSYSAGVAYKETFTISARQR